MSEFQINKVFFHIWSAACVVSHSLTCFFLAGVYLIAAFYFKSKEIK